MQTSLQSSRLVVPSLRRKAASATLGLVLAWGGVYSAASLRAELTWKEKTVELDAEPKATVLEARYPFTNEGKTPVDIQEIHTSCGCTTAELSKRHYEPGEGGEIVARYTVDERTGLQKKTIAVSTSDQPEATTLMLNVRLPELFHLNQTFVTWKSGEAPHEKVLPVAVPPGTPALEDLTIRASNTAVNASIQPTKEGYDIHVTPVTTTKPAFVTLVVHGRIGEAEKSFRVYATVEQAVPPSVEKPTAQQ